MSQGSDQPTQPWSFSFPAFGGTYAIPSRPYPSRGTSGATNSLPAQSGTHQSSLSNSSVPKFALPSNEASSNTVVNPTSSSEPSEPKIRLTDLPDELILKILSFIPQWDFRTIPSELYAFLDIAKTCRKLNNISAEFIYKRFANDKQDVRLLARTFTTHRPEFASHLQEFLWMAWLEKKRPSTPDPEEDRIIRGRLTNLLSNIDSNLKLDDASQMEAIISLILLQAEKLKSLKLQPRESQDRDHEFPTPIWLRILSLAASGNTIGLPHTFEHLHSIRLGMGTLKLNEVASMLTLPSLRHVDMYDVQQIAPITLTCAPRSSPVIGLSMDTSYIRWEVLEQFLSCFTALRNFQYDQNISWPRELDSYPVGLHYEKLTEVLRAHKDSIEGIQIRDQHPHDHDVSEGHFGDLRDFSRLAVLTLSFDALPGNASTKGRLSDILPSSLEVLSAHIEDPEEEEAFYDMCAEDLALAPKSSHPKLMHVDADMNYPSHEADPDLIERGEEVETLFAKKGVFFGQQYDDLDIDDLDDGHFFDEDYDEDYDDYYDDQSDLDSEGREIFFCPNCGEFHGIGPGLMDDDGEDEGERDDDGDSWETDSEGDDSDGGMPELVPIDQPQT